MAIKKNKKRTYYSPPKTKYLEHSLGKLSISSFDGSKKRTSRAWLQKLDTYLALKHVFEEDAIKFTTLYLEGVAHYWWYHGLITQGHKLIKSHDESCSKIVERFDRRDPKEHFRELAYLK
jgi:hypothetical protein